jgi:hypothetical protein
MPGLPKGQRHPPELRERALRDAELKVHIGRVHEENLFVYSATKIWAQLNAEGIRVARCTVERLMPDGPVRQPSRSSMSTSVASSSSARRGSSELGLGPVRDDRDTFGWVVEVVEAGGGAGAGYRVDHESFPCPGGDDRSAGFGVDEAVEHVGGDGVASPTQVVPELQRDAVDRMEEAFGNGAVVNGVVNGGPEPDPENEEGPPERP